MVKGHLPCSPAGCYSNLLLKWRSWTGILWRGVLCYVLPRFLFLWGYGVFRCSISLRVIIVFRDITYVIIILYSWRLVIYEHFWPYVWNNWSLVMHTMSTWFWHKNWVWQKLPVLFCEGLLSGAQYINGSKASIEWSCGFRRPLHDRALHATPSGSYGDSTEIPSSTAPIDSKRDCANWEVHLGDLLLRRPPNCRSHGQALWTALSIEENHTRRQWE
jgi:hypothetical protein